MYLRYLVIFLITTIVVACSEKGRDVIDPAIDMSRKEYEHKLVPKKSSENDKPTSSEPPLPDMSQILVTPQPPAIGKDKLVTLNITEAVPLKDVLIELGRLAEIDIEVDPRIMEGIILKVKDKPLAEVIDTISQLASLRYNYDKGILTILRDLPYLVTYHADFINMNRSNEGSVTVKSSLDGGGSGTSSNSGSSNKVTTTYDGDLWKSVQDDIKKMLEYHKESASMPASAASAGMADQGINAQLVPAKAAAAPAAAKGAAAAAAGGGEGISINKQAGLITVIATERQHKEIQKYLNSVKATVSSQVLIEAKVVEVTLSDAYNTGVNWSIIDSKLGGINTQYTATGGNASEITTVGVTKALSAVTSLDALVTLTDQFGITRTLSSPRIQAMNNQEAVLSFVTNQVYFTISETVTPAVITGGVTTTPEKDVFTSTLHTVPIGFMLSLQPSINPDTNEITMNMRPTITRITGQVADPALSYTSGGKVTSNIPIVEAREMDSVLKIKSGQIMVIGGYIEDSTNNSDNGVPYAGSVPFAGNLFKSVSKNKTLKQTIIFVKATITPTSNVTAYDKKFYKDFTQDPNPLAF